MEMPECSSVDKCINKSDAHTNRGRLFKLLKKGDPPICRNMGETGGLYAKWNKTDSKGEKNPSRSPLYKESNSIELASFLIEEI